MDAGGDGGYETRRLPFPISTTSARGTAMAATSSVPAARALAPLLLLLLLLLLGVSPAPSRAADPPPLPPSPAPAAWPHQFHAALVVNYSGELSLIDLWYDWPKGRNFNIIQKQLGKLLYDLEWDNGTSFYYTLDASRGCTTRHFPVGILRPDWLDGATYLGRQRVDGFLCDAWEKAGFITYYEDVATRRPANWVFYTGRSAHVMTFEVGAVLEDEKWQAPVYCFDKGRSIAGRGSSEQVVRGHLSELRGFLGFGMHMGAI